MSQKEEFEGRIRRKYRRVPARDVQVELKYRGTVATYPVKNLSAGGLLIGGARSLPRGAVLDLELQLKGIRPVQVVGKVLYEIPEGMGVAFNPYGSDVALSLEKVIAALDAKNAMPPPLPVGRTTSHDELPPAGPRPGDDPFTSDAVDPRPPRSGSPDERAEYLRTLLKNRDESLKRGRVMLASLVQEIEAVRAAAARLKSKLDLSVGQQQLNDAALAAARKQAEKQLESQLQERSAHEARLEEQQRQTLEAIAAVSSLEAKLRRQEQDAARAKEEAEAARREAKGMAADTAGLRKSREELASANKKAMEAHASATKEKAARQALEKQLTELKAAHAAALADRQELAEEVAKLKSKLIAAENALDRMPRRTAAVARK